MQLIAIIDCLWQVHKGIKGQVRDAETGEGIVGATVTVVGVRHDVVSVEGGEYWRLLSPGTYTITVSKHKCGSA